MGNPFTLHMPINLEYTVTYALSRNVHLNGDNSTQLEKSLIIQVITMIVSRD